MIVQSKRAKDIDTYIEDHPSCKLEFYKHDVEINGEKVSCDTYRLPISLIIFNHDNGRLFWEIQDYESNVIKRRLNPEDKDDALKIKELLLNNSDRPRELSDKAKDLYDDIRRVGQLEPGAITHDGILINGNRRMAVLQKLNIDEPTGKWDKIWVYRLPNGISEADLWGIEAGLQLSEKKIAEYGALNELLKIKAGKKIGLSESEIAARMYGWTETKVSEKLEKLNLIENFLEFVGQGQPMNYGLINKFEMNEIFEDVQTAILNASIKKGIPAKERTKQLSQTYALIRTKIPKFSVKEFNFNLTHNHIRTLGKILNDNTDARLKFQESFEDLKNIKDVSSDKLVSNFNEAVDIIDYQKYKDKPKDLLTKAISALENIDRRNSHFLRSEEVKKKVLQLEKIIQSMKIEIGI